MTAKLRMSKSPERIKIFLPITEEANKDGVMHISLEEDISKFKGHHWKEPLPINYLMYLNEKAFGADIILRYW